MEQEKVADFNTFLISIPREATQEMEAQPKRVTCIVTKDSIAVVKMKRALTMIHLQIIVENRVTMTRLKSL